MIIPLFAVLLFSALLPTETEAFRALSPTFAAIGHGRYSAFPIVERKSGLIQSRQHQQQHIQPHGHRSSRTRAYGIPKLFRWLIDLYPLVVESVGSGISNSDMEVDNFYLDMNGIIHTCTHSNNDRLIPLQEKEMFLRIFAYTDRLYKLVKPSKLMYLAVDGVAPRAKMNQQRARRFRSAKEREALIADHVAREGAMPDVESFDSNCITPGTEFMYRLGIAFRRWIQYKMTTDPFWQENSAEVIFSGPDVPGEGEHKVMDKIRADKRNDRDYFPGKRRHCMYGLDADLIMLSLVTHEPYFILLREKIKTRNLERKDPLQYTPEDFELLDVSILRKMLKQHNRPLLKLFGDADSNSGSDSDSNSSDDTIASSGRDTTNESDTSSSGGGRVATGFSLERVIDDFVFMCFLIGNDFLPNIPHMSIESGSLTALMNTYRDLLPGLGGYITDKAAIHLPRLELFVQEMARREPLYFQERALIDQDDAYAGEDYRAHYYKIKFGITPGDEESIREVVHSYVQGLYWVLTYYHDGCGSWTWFYPHLYAPLASDLVRLADFNTHLEAGEPFTPLLQLLSVLPPQSGALLPRAYADIMTNPSSPLSQYYPPDFVVDLNGKKNDWECVVCIPFIEEKMMLVAANKIDHLSVLSRAERLRNIPGVEHSFQPTAEAIAAATGATTGGDKSSQQRRKRSGASTAAVDLRDAGTWGNALVDSRMANRVSNQQRGPRRVWTSKKISSGGGR